MRGWFLLTSQLRELATNLGEGPTMATAALILYLIGLITAFGIRTLTT